jgi:hypothetical protein
MITLQEFKDSLGDEARELTEEQIIKLKDNMEQTAEIFFNMWLDEIKNKNITEINKDNSDKLDK